VHLLGFLVKRLLRCLLRQVSEYNHNLQVNPEKYSTLVATTHGVGDRIETIKILKRYPIKVCSGGIIGLGETMEDRIKLAAGRETIMKDFQGLAMLSGANGFLIGGYLTTKGREVEEDIRFLEELYEFQF